MIEIDLQLTADGRVVVFHDDRLERTTDGRGRLDRTPFSQLCRLDAGTWFHRRFAGERVLLLSQALRAVPSRVRFNLELKHTRHGAALIRALRRQLAGRVPHGRLVLSSFDAKLVALAKPLGFPVALICRRFAARALGQAIRLGCASWHPKAGLVTQTLVKRAQAAGLRVYAWTVDEPRLAARLAALGVDGLFTNHPARLITWQRAQGAA